MRVYLDNAATTPLDKEVFDAMAPFMLEHFGNPSSIHTHGRQVRAAVENARKTIAGLINASPAEVFFTSGGTEADNHALLREGGQGGQESQGDHERDCGHGYRGGKGCYVHDPDHPFRLKERSAL